MQVPLQVTFRDVPHSDALEQKIREKVDKLEKLYNRMVRCKVVIEKPHRTHFRGALYHVSIFIVLPGNEIVVGRDPADEHQHEDPYVAVRDAFDAAKRQLQDYLGKFPPRSLRTHNLPPHGKIAKLFYEDGGYGFLITDDGREVYFNRNSVLGGHFEFLEIGTVVRFKEEQGTDGPQASTVEIVGKDGKRSFG